MGVLTLILKLPPIPLSNNTLLNGQSQAFDPKKKGDFFLIHSNKINQCP
jgi:hypothetical protein